MKKTLIIAFLMSFSMLNSQNNADFLKEINRDIWQPFIVAYGSLDAEKYKTLHATDFIRAQGDSKTLPTAADYFNNSATWFADERKKGNRLAIEFRFIERFANGTVGSERGIYQLKSFDKDGKIQWTGYGKFHVFLRKQANIWKIAVDYDSNEKGAITEKTYSEAFAVDDFEKY